MIREFSSHILGKISKRKRKAMKKEKLISINKINILRIILIILLLCTFFIIFGFSSQNGEQSGGISRKVTEIILKASSNYNKLEEEEKEIILHRTESIIRKVAHFLIYTVVGFLLMGLLSTYKIQDKWRLIMTIGIGILYAMSDEFHQSFSPGRSPKVTDVYIDTLGVIVGALLVIFIRMVYQKIKKVSPFFETKILKEKMK